MPLRALAFAACAMGAMGATLGGCGGSSPTGAVQTLCEAAREGDRQAVLQVLGPRTRARLVADADRASEQAGRRHLAPDELLAAGWTPPRWEMQDAAVVSRARDEAVVEVRGRRGERERVDVVREAGKWKVELP